MAKERTDDSRFPSNKGGGWVSAPQYITECLCILIARQDKKQLGERFWQQPYWARIFRTQIPAANELLQEYSAKIIIDTLRDKRCWKIKSLRARYLLDPILKEKAAAQATIDAVPVVVMEKTETVQATRQRRGKSLISMLRESEKNEPRPD